MNRHHYGLILAGGRGTRFWPLSRKRSAKQVLNVVGERSLIQSTVDRLAPVIPPERLWILTNDHLRDVIVKQLPEIPKRQILAEPAQRNTAPAIGLAAQILQSHDPNAVMGVFPADHVVGKETAYRAVVRAALKGASAGNLMLVGIQPRWPETGYGYVEFPRTAKAGGSEAIEVLRFHEKPVLAKAKRYLAAGNFYWNSGMFFWRTDVLLNELRQHLPKTATILAALPPFTSRRFAEHLAKAFPLCDNISIDFAVLEKAAKVAGIAAGDFGWNDVGSWNAVYELMGRDGCGNVVANNSVCLDAHDNFVDARGKTVALLGVKDLIVVDTPDALLVATRDRAQQVGDIVKFLEKNNRHELL
jgi:mannose-1-phosphate guanylyltransferase